MDIPNLTFLGVDPDEPIYRIFPLWSFERTLEHKALDLMNPAEWEDPYENTASNTIAQISGARPPLQGLDQHLSPVYAQCWSREQESDVLLRAYSRVMKDPHFHRNIYPRDEGVRIRSTPLKLLRSLTSHFPSFKQNCFIGAIRYFDADRIHEYVANQVDRLGLRAFETPRARAELLLLKRRAYKHESEVRLIYVGQRDTKAEPLTRITIDPNAVFEEAMYDPRLDRSEQVERQAVAQRLGYNGSFVISPDYVRPLLMVKTKGLPEA